MAGPDTAPHHQLHVPKGSSGRHGSAARSKLPHGVVHHPDIRELLRNSAMHLGGNDATVAHLKDGMGSHDPLNHLAQRDASRIAHGLLGARRHASPQSKDLYTSAIHHMGYRFDEHCHIHKVHEVNFSAAMKNSAFRAHMAVEHYVAAQQSNVGHDGLVGAGRQVEMTLSRGVSSSGSGIDRSGRGGMEGNIRGLAPTL
jgi:hypothetical protein